MTEAEANRIQIARCRAEVDRIQRQGEKYRNGRLVDSISLSELRALRLQLLMLAEIGRANDKRTVAPGSDNPRGESGQYCFGGQ